MKFYLVFLTLVMLLLNLPSDTQGCGIGVPCGPKGCGTRRRQMADADRAANAGEDDNTDDGDDNADSIAEILRRRRMRRN